MKDFIKFIADRQQLYIDKQNKKPWPQTSDPVFLKAKINNCFRRQDAVSKFELNELKGKRFSEQCFIILVMRQAITICMYELLKMKEPRSLKDLDTLKAKIGSGNEYINTCIQFSNRKGSTREDLIIEHYDTVLKTHVSFSKKLLLCKSADETIGLIREWYPRLGPFRTYEVYTSLTYCSKFKFTENDYLFIGPGSKDVIIKYSNGATPNLPQAKILADKVGEELKKKKVNLLGQAFTVRALEDSFCEFRKYITAKNSAAGTVYYPSFFPKPLRYEVRGAERKLFSPTPKSILWEIDTKPSNNVKLCSWHVLPIQALVMLKRLPHGEVLTKQNIVDIVETHKEELNTRQSADRILSFYFGTFVDLGFIKPTSAVTRKRK